MTGYMAAAAALLIAGVVIGVLIVICLGIHREERRGSLTKESDSRIDRGVRRLNGAGSRGYWLRAVPDDDSYDGDSYDDSYDQAAKWLASTGRGRSAPAAADTKDRPRRRGCLASRPACWPSRYPCRTRRSCRPGWPPCP